MNFFKFKKLNSLKEVKTCSIHNVTKNLRMKNTFSYDETTAE